MRDVDTIFESPFPSETSVPEPEWDQDYAPKFPQDFDEEADELATEAFLHSLGMAEEIESACARRR